MAKPRARVCGAGARTRVVRGHAPPEIFEKMVKICAIWCILGHVLRGDNSIVFGAKTSKSPSHNRSCSNVKISVVVLAIGVRGHVLPEKKEKKKNKIVQSEQVNCHFREDFQRKGSTMGMPPGKFLKKEKQNGAI